MSFLPGPSYTFNQTPVSSGRVLESEYMSDATTARLARGERRRVGIARVAMHSRPGRLPSVETVPTNEHF
jgi:hypothetical protein